MPRTKQLPELRIGRNVPRMVAAARRIVRTSPESEPKSDMKRRVYNRERITIGDPKSRPKDLQRR